MNISGYLVNATDMINLSIDGIFEASGIDTLSYVKNFTSNGTFPISLFYFGNTTHLASNTTYYAFITEFNSSNSQTNSSNSGNSGNGNSGGNNQGQGASPDTGNPESTSKYRTGQAPATSQAPKSESKAPSASQSQQGVSDSASQKQGQSSPLTGAAVLTKPKSWKDLLSSIFHPSDKAVGLFFFFIFMAIAVVSILKRIKSGKDPIIQNLPKIFPSPEKRSHTQQNLHQQYIRTLRREYDSEAMLSKLNKINKSYAFRQPGQQRNINIKPPLPEKVSSISSKNAVKSLREVYKLD